MEETGSGVSWLSQVDSWTGRDGEALNVAATAATCRATNLLHVQALQTFPFIGHKKPTLTAIIFPIFTIFTAVVGNLCRK